MWVATIWNKGFDNPRKSFTSHELGPVDVVDQAINFLADAGEFMALTRKPGDSADNYWEYHVMDIPTREKHGGVSVEWVD